MTEEKLSKKKLKYFLKNNMRVGVRRGICSKNKNKQF